MVLSAAVVRLLGMYTIQISFELPANDEKVTASNPGGQWLIHRGLEVVPSLSHASRNNTFFPYISRLEVQTLRKQKNLREKN